MGGHRRRGTVHDMWANMGVLPAGLAGVVVRVALVPLYMGPVSVWTHMAVRRAVCGW
jgi:hypothetical protein